MLLLSAPRVPGGHRLNPSPDPIRPGLVNTGTVQVDTAGCLWGLLGFFPGESPKFCVSPLVSDRHLNLHQYFKNFDYLVNEAANFKVPESNKTIEMLTWMMSCVCAGWGVIRSLKNLGKTNRCVFPGLESGTGGWCT